MSGSLDSGAKAAETNRRKYGDDYYAKIGAMGGKKGRTGGFYGDPERAREIGRKGGLSVSPESRRLAALKAWETKRRKE